MLGCFLGAVTLVLLFLYLFIPDLNPETVVYELKTENSPVYIKRIRDDRKTTQITMSKSKKIDTTHPGYMIKSSPLFCKMRNDTVITYSRKPMKQIKPDSINFTLIENVIEDNPSFMTLYENYRNLGLTEIQ